MVSGSDTRQCEFEQHVIAIWAKYGRYDLTFKDFEDFTQLRVSLGGRAVGNAIEHGALTPTIAEAYWMRIREADSLTLPHYLLFVCLAPETTGDLELRIVEICMDSGR
jgi:DNA helicase-2/ATP-dependent DNA helicase PcrA